MMRQDRFTQQAQEVLLLVGTELYLPVRQAGLCPGPS